MFESFVPKKIRVARTLGDPEPAVRKSCPSSLLSTLNDPEAFTIAADELEKKSTIPNSEPKRDIERFDVDLGDLDNHSSFPLYKQLTIEASFSLLPFLMTSQHQSINIGDMLLWKFASANVEAANDYNFSTILRKKQRHSNELWTETVIDNEIPTRVTDPVITATKRIETLYLRWHEALRSAIENFIDASDNVFYILGDSIRSPLYQDSKLFLSVVFFHHNTDPCCFISGVDKMFLRKLHQRRTNPFILTPDVSKRTEKLHKLAKQTMSTHGEHESRKTGKHVFLRGHYDITTVVHCIQEIVCSFTTGGAFSLQQSHTLRLPDLLSRNRFLHAVKADHIVNALNCQKKFISPKNLNPETAELSVMNNLELPNKDIKTTHKVQLHGMFDIHGLKLLVQNLIDLSRTPCEECIDIDATVQQTSTSVSDIYSYLYGDSNKSVIIEGGENKGNVLQRETTVGFKSISSTTIQTTNADNMRSSWSSQTHLLSDSHRPPLNSIKLNSSTSAVVNKPTIKSQKTRLQEFKGTSLLSNPMFLFTSKAEVDTLNEEDKSNSKSIGVGNTVSSTSVSLQAHNEIKRSQSVMKSDIDNEEKPFFRITVTPFSTSRALPYLYYPSTTAISSNENEQKNDPNLNSVTSNNCKSNTTSLNCNNMETCDEVTMHNDEYDVDSYRIKNTESIATAHSIAVPTQSQSNFCSRNTDSSPGITINNNHKSDSTKISDITQLVLSTTSNIKELYWPPRDRPIDGLSTTIDENEQINDPLDSDVTPASLKCDLQLQIPPPPMKLIPVSWEDVAPQNAIRKKIESEGTLLQPLKVYDVYADA